MEEKHNEAEDVDRASSDSFFIDSDDDEPSTSGQDDGLRFEEHLTEKEIEELVSEFLEVESRAAEAQETLEKESLAKVESEVREELAQSLQGDDLETAVADEMATFIEQWEGVLDELETESAQLLEQLDGAGIELPSLYKWIESQAPNGCCTEAWKTRAHWVGSQVTSEAAESLAGAEKNLQTLRPVRRKHGRLLEEGAGGFLQKKLSNDASQEAPTGKSDIDWSSFMKICSNGLTEDDTGFGSKNWASVYLASTPQQAALMGLKFPGVDEVEEIEDIDGSSDNPLVADAIENEKELILSEEQRKSFRKVKEEDDVNIDRKFQLHLKQKRHRRRSKQVKDSKLEQSQPFEDDPNSVSNKEHQEERDCVPNNENGVACRTLKNDMLDSFESCKPDWTQSSPNRKSSEHFESDKSGSGKPVGSKRSNEDMDANENNKKARTVIIASDDEADSTVKDELISSKSEDQFIMPEKCGAAVGVESITEKFICTACYKLAVEVQQHPLLKVIICRECKYFLEEKMHMKGPDCSECYCGWCGQSKDLLSCKSCKTLFCMKCIRKNIGEECLLEVQASGWQCCSCLPTLLQKLASELERAIAFQDTIVSSSDSDSENSDTDDINTSISSKREPKKKIRRILDDAELGEETKRKIAIEKERQERLKSMQFSAKYNVMNSSSCSRNLLDEASLEVLGDANTGYIVNVRREDGEEAVRIPPSISAKLKVHQIAGIRFMWENIIQSITKVKSGDKGLGCILAHTMGLGKTFQVIAFLYTAMRSVDLGLKTTLIVTPVNVLHNWRQEFMKWRPSELKPLRVFMLEDVTRERRAELLAKWIRKGGVFLIGYTAFRNLSFGKHVKDRNMARDICYALQICVVIEALLCFQIENMHGYCMFLSPYIKNTRADTTQALKQVKCQRRIALTGSPLQNNLMEYYCLKGFVQRMDMSVVKNDLPPKTVFVITVKLSPLQRKLYKRFLDVHGFANDRPSNEKIRKSFFAGYQALAQLSYNLSVDDDKSRMIHIWNHPGILQLNKDAVENFLADESSSDENIDYNVGVGGLVYLLLSLSRQLICSHDLWNLEGLDLSGLLTAFTIQAIDFTCYVNKMRSMNDSLHEKNDYAFIQKGWWRDILHQNIYKELDYSGKMVLLLDIITMCSDVGDKALVFSQSIPTLDLIELYLSRLPSRGKKGKFWKKGKDWYRLDGKTESSERQKLVERFNEPTNSRVKCTLISTRAGSLGINLYAANRVVIVDGSWNPTYDLQAIYRAWRYGQKKPVFAYRLMAHGTMEEKIYKRQVTKEGLAARVEELMELSEENGNQNTANEGEKSLKQKIPLSHGSCSSDKVMESLLGKHHPRWIANFHEHETLLQENEDEKLSKEEQDMAWEVFQKTLEWEEVQRVSLDESATAAERRPVVPEASPPKPDPVMNHLTKPQGIFRSRIVQRKCTNLAHLLTLRSQGTKFGCSTVCGECAQEISWDNLNRDSKITRGKEVEGSERPELDWTGICSLLMK
ncbi:Protein CHROMATIN REMODELING 20 [Hibiscus syriacus]|uniref:ATP-dependent helicase ATRX n=1 Tax=Hibiscus syriacus TaxID=106335 RepID=A0A6A2WPG0_HIBSY|nr:Protein CHROMATIN REMODELING 20 [Hibiscus syriacus]